MMAAIVVRYKSHDGIQPWSSLAGTYEGSASKLEEFQNKIFEYGSFSVFVNNSKLKKKNWREELTSCIANEPQIRVRNFI